MTAKRKYIIPEVMVENYRTRDFLMFADISTAPNAAPQRVERRDPAF